MTARSTAAFRVYLSVASSLILVDQLIKWWTRATFEVHEAPGYPWPGVFELTLTYNRGIAFGMMQGHGELFVPIALAMAGGCGWYVWRHPEESRLATISLALLTAGAIGNMIDRAILGQVTDMFWFRLINFPVFNFADACITIAGGLLALSMLREPHRRHEIGLAEGSFPESPSTEPPKM